MPEVSGGNAVLADPNKLEDITLGINQLLKNEAKRAEMSKKGLAWVKNFTWEKVAQETIAVFEKVAKG